ncbi:hypothetical protein GJQ57_12640 [Ralstonia pickettii]|uniref:Transmembrane protein n=1 Tax=Ralstonia pickettii TaxID=329 RepID=A0A7X2HN04_RALPI|nr:hypothetical protein [Ralstonia pickettii]MRS99492.1 hypothetical protein [Ralstonia pickettii]
MEKAARQKWPVATLYVAPLILFVVVLYFPAILDKLGVWPKPPAEWQFRMMRLWFWIAGAAPIALHMWLAHVIGARRHLWRLLAMLVVLHYVLTLIPFTVALGGGTQLSSVRLGSESLMQIGHHAMIAVGWALLIGVALLIERVVRLLLESDR